MPVIKLKNNEISYDFSFEQKYLFIRGDSGIGKTSLIQLVSDYNTNPDAIICDGDTNIKVLNSENDLIEKNTVFFLDENMPLLYRSDCSTLLNNSDNYFIIINRSRKFDGLKTGLDSLVIMRAESDGSHTIEPAYPKESRLNQLADTIICEDTNSGKLFLEQVFGIHIEAAGSKDRLAIAMRKLNKSQYTIVYDRAGISFSYEDQMDYLKQKNIKVVSEIDWDSLESYVLESDDYGVKVDWFPDKEQNAVRLMKELFPNYNKSMLPQDMKLPIYWKIKDAQELLEKSQHKTVSIDAF